MKKHHAMKNNKGDNLHCNLSILPQYLLQYQIKRISTVKS